MVLVKSGRTEAGQAAAATHTAALAGSDKVFTAVCEQFGVIQVDDVDEMVDVMQLMAAFGKKLAGSGRISIVTQSGGMGSLTADLCHQAGLLLPPLSDAVQTKLHELPHLLQFGDLGNPADVRGASVIGSATSETLKPFLQDPETDIVLLLLAKSTLREGEDDTANAIVEAVEQSEKPLVVVWVGQRDAKAMSKKNSIDYGQQPTDNGISAAQLLVNAGVPVFESSRRAVGALALAVRYWQFRKRWMADPEVKHEH